MLTIEQLENRLKKKVDLIEDKLIFPKLKKEIDANKVLL